MEPIQADFIPRAAFLNFLKQNGDAAVRVAEILRKILPFDFLEVRYLGLFSSAAEKFAPFQLDLPTRSPDEKDNRATLTLTHREIGQTIGASRETATRLFANFKHEGLVEVHGLTVVFLDRNKLEKIIPG
jgi:CRP-like cAMP-binding protein